ncbi:dye-decolorizing peroxidase YfeX-like [Watersipora subatra]|uniref:dye-decolorizing peroxidase YfeX-like n=1 Tax=Watersipora subatra TaxID=2589382 RepID=UPI00355C7A5D
MASMFTRGFRFVRKIASIRSQPGAIAGGRVVVPLMLGGAATATALAYAKADILKETVSISSLRLSAAESEQFQDSVISGTKENALYLWIYLSPKADRKKCAKVVANLQAHVDAVCPPDMRDEDDEVLAGVGFGPNFFNQLYGRKPAQSFHYPHRQGDYGELPSSGGDIFIHAKSNSRSKLFELAQRIMAQLPAGSVQSFEDIYGWVYQNGKDLSGFIDGTENPADDESRENVAVEKGTGGSYVITQKWIHDHKFLASTPTKTLETAVGRDRADSIELSRKHIQSHVARMTGGNAFEQKKAYEIVRQSQPWGTVSGDSGLFFIGYAASPENFEYMLERMVGAGGDGHSDLIMTMTSCVKGTYWYFPSKKELKSVA